MFKVGDRVKVVGGNQHVGKAGTVVLLDDSGYMDIIVSLDNHKVTDFFSLMCCQEYGVPDSSEPFEPYQLALLEA